MHDIEPWWGWREEYAAERDQKSPFFGRSYNEFQFTSRIYNYYIHPQWDYFGSETLYAKLLFVDYRQKYALIELIGEWNDCIENDISYLKRDLADALIEHNISRFVFFCDNVLNFHGDEDCYYEEWYEDVRDENGWVCLVNTYAHVYKEMQKYRLQHFIHFGEVFNEMQWRALKPAYIIELVEGILQGSQKQLL